MGKQKANGRSAIISKKPITNGITKPKNKKKKVQQEKLLTEGDKILIKETLKKKQENMSNYLNTLSDTLEGSMISQPQNYALPFSQLHDKCLEMLHGIYASCSFKIPLAGDTIKNQMDTLKPKPIYINGLDDDQIWEQIQMYNGPMIDYLETSINKITDRDLVNVLENLKEREIIDDSELDEEDEDEDMENDEDFDNEEIDDSNENQLDGQEEIGNLEDQEEFDEESDQEHRDKQKEDGDKDLTGMDKDKIEKLIFSEKAMHQFMDEGEAIENEISVEEDESDEELANLLYGEEMEDDEVDGETAKYDDFFDPPGQNGTAEDPVEQEIEEDLNDALETVANEEKEKLSQIKELEKKLLEEDEEDHKETLSGHELKKARLQKRIEQLEQKNLQDKEWHMAGEVFAKQRPKNSILEQDLDFDFGAKVKPVITEEFTSHLESMIKHRIKEFAFDDVIQRRFDDEKKKGDWRNNMVDVDMGKSKKSLAEVYEDFYKSKVDDIPVETPVMSKQHLEIRKLFKSLCRKLDALCNVHYTPYKTKEEVDYKNDLAEEKKDKNVPAIQAEEVTPLAVSTADRLAPEELYEKEHRHLVNRAELTQEERKSHRSNKKKNFKKSQGEKEYKTKERERQTKLDNEGKGMLEDKDKSYKDIKNNSMDKAIQELKKSKNVKFVNSSDNTTYSSSSQFFKKLQNDNKASATQQKNK